MPGELIVSVSGVSAATLSAADEFQRLVDARGVPLSLLVAPRRKHGYRLENDAKALTWLRARQDRGDAVVLHGYDEALTKRRRGEFATLAAHEATLRLAAADRVLEEVGLRTRLFAAPGWTASPGTVRALPRNGFRVLIGRAGTVDLTTGRERANRLLSIGAGSRAEPWWCRALILAAERTARRGGDVRLAITAKQLADPGPRQAILDAIDLTLMHGNVPSVYRSDRDGSLRQSA